MDRISHVRHVLPFLDALDLARSESVNRTWCSSAAELNLWEGLCAMYKSTKLATRAGRDVPWPEQGQQSLRQYTGALHALERLILNNDVQQCEGCVGWLREDDGFTCEECQGFWCDECKNVGPDKIQVPCKLCPDFSKSHCHQCFDEGRTEYCECKSTDSWHSCCGRHAFDCEKCGACLCDGCCGYHECGDEDD